MPTTATIQVYTFDELSDTAKDHARYTLGPWSWQSEWWDSAQAFNKIAPITITAADYDRRHVTTAWGGDDDVADLSGVRAWKWLQNHGWFDLSHANAQGGCTLTGYCGDCDLFDAIEKVRHDPNKITSLKELFIECAQDWVIAAAKDCEYAYTDEHMKEMCEGNDYKFTEDGRLFS